jgi:hypothetical protein
MRAGERFNALRFLAAMPVEHQIAGDGEEPGFKFPPAVVLMAALENPQPGFLKKVFGALLVAGEVDQVAEQAELVLLDETVEEIGIAASERAGERLGVVEHEGGEAYRAGPGRSSGARRVRIQDREEEAHVSRNTCGGAVKTQGEKRPACFRDGSHERGSI